MAGLGDAYSRESTPVLPHVELEILRGRAKQKIRPVETPVFLIGSAHDCDLVLADPTFPEVHTYLYVNPGRVSVRRLGEGPDLLVDGRIVQSSPIVHGQRLSLAGYEFAVRISDPQRCPMPEEAEATTIVDAAPARSDYEQEGVCRVRALLADIRDALRLESNLKLYVEQELPWKAVTADETLLVKASA